MYQSRAHCLALHLKKNKNCRYQSSVACALPHFALRCFVHFLLRQFFFTLPYARAHFLEGERRFSWYHGDCKVALASLFVWNMRDLRESALQCVAACCNVCCSWKIGWCHRDCDVALASLCIWEIQIYRKNSERVYYLRHSNHSDCKVALASLYIWEIWEIL